SRSWTTKVEIPPSVSGRRDPVTLRLEDGFDNAYDPVMTEVSLAGSPRPRFAFSWQVSSQDGLGLPVPGRKPELCVDGHDLGEGPRWETTLASIKSKGSEKIFIERGGWKVGAIAPGVVAEAKFELELKEGYPEETTPLRLDIFDGDLEELTVEELEIPVL